MPKDSSDAPKAKLVGHAIGRRKRAIASVRLTTGTGHLTVNGQPINQYFPGPSAQAIYALPFQLVSVEKYDASIKVHGGGKASQLDAAVLGISRVLSEIKKDYRKTLSDAHLLTRDSRERQRRMVGTGGKSRRRKQSPKR